MSGHSLTTIKCCAVYARLANQLQLVWKGDHCHGSYTSLTVAQQLNHAQCNCGLLFLISLLQERTLQLLLPSVLFKQTSRQGHKKVSKRDGVSECRV